MVRTLLINEIFSGRVHCYLISLINSNGIYKLHKTLSHAENKFSMCEITVSEPPAKDTVRQKMKFFLSYIVKK